MAQLKQAFDATQWDPTQSAGQLPIGRHKVIATSSEIKATNANDGGYLIYDIAIIEGPHAGITGEMFFNLYSSNPDYVASAHRKYSAFCHAVGVYNVQDTSQLHNIPFVVEVGNKKPTKDQADARARGEEVTLYTDVKKVFDVNGNVPGKKTAAPAPAAQPAQATGTAPNFNVAPAAWGEPANATPAQSGTAWDPPAQAAQAPAAPPTAQAWQGGTPAGAKPAWAK